MEQYFKNISKQLYERQRDLDLLKIEQLDQLVCNFFFYLISVINNLKTQTNVFK